METALITKSGKPLASSPIPPRLTYRINVYIVNVLGRIERSKQSMNLSQGTSVQRQQKCNANTLLLTPGRTACRCLGSEFYRRLGLLYIEHLQAVVGYSLAMPVS